MSSNASAKATSEKPQGFKEPIGVRVHSMWSRFVDGTQETQKGLKGYKVTVQEIKFKTARCPFVGVRSFHSSEEVW